MSDDPPSWLPFPKGTKRQRREYEEHDLTCGVGAELSELRKNEGLQQAQVADAVGIGRTSITNIEAGRQKLSVMLLFKIADALGYDVDIRFIRR